MFVAVACEFGNTEHKHSAYNLLLQYGFKKTLANVYESTTINEGRLLRLKRELDRMTDSYDILRFYQYPYENTLVLSSLKEKKWRKSIIRV